HFIVLSCSPDIKGTESVNRDCTHFGVYHSERSQGVRPECPLKLDLRSRPRAAGYGSVAPTFCQIEANLKRTNRLRRAELLRENRKRRVLGTNAVDQRSL